MRVLQLIDSLHAGGAERMAVNLANGLVGKVEDSFLCATREEGILKNSINPNVHYLFLNKKRTFDFAAIKRLNRYIKENQINIIHAHSSSFFLATIIKLLNKEIKLMWHDHYGNSEFLSKRKSVILKQSSRCFDHVFCVNRNLEDWAKQYLKVDSVEYLPNFVIVNKEKPETKLFGTKGKRIICLANLRPQKDHITLINAFNEVSKKYPDWTLHFVGKNFEDDYSRKIKETIKFLNLDKQIYLYGSRPDISQILKQCDIGILSSKSEGLPLALLEYGLANLSVIATRVGQCHEVVISNDYGILVNAENVKELQLALDKLIENEKYRQTSSENLKDYIEVNFSANSIIKRIVNNYNSIN